MLVSLRMTLCGRLLLRGLMCIVVKVLWLLMMLVDTSWLRAPVHLVFKWPPPPSSECSLWAWICDRRFLCSSFWLFLFLDPDQSAKQFNCPGIYVHPYLWPFLYAKRMTRGSAWAHRAAPMWTCTCVCEVYLEVDFHLHHHAEGTLTVSQIQAFSSFVGLL